MCESCKSAEIVTGGMRPGHSCPVCGGSSQITFEDDGETLSGRCECGSCRSYVARSVPSPGEDDGKICDVKMFLAVEFARKWNERPVAEPTMGRIIALLDGNDASMR